MFDNNTHRASPVKEYHSNTYAANDPCEDRLVAIADDSGAYFGVFDGHGGVGAVTFVKEALTSYIQDSLKKSLKESDNWIEAVRRGLIRAFEVADRDFIRNADFDNHRLADVYAGSCALTAYCVKGTLFVANAGDCRAVLVRKVERDGRSTYETIQLSNDHTAETEKEKLVREHPNEPDVVLKGAIKGNLEPSRAFGDALFKDKIFNFYLHEEYQMPQPFTPPYVTATPEVFVHQLRSGDKFLIMATDGLWDFMSNEEAAEIVIRHQLYGDRNENVCTILIKKVLEKSAPNGSTSEERISSAIQLDPKEKRKFHDDISIVVIYFDENRLGKVQNYELRPEHYQPNIGHLRNNYRMY